MKPKTAFYAAKWVEQADAELTTAAGQGKHGYPDNLEPPYAHNEVESRVMLITLNFLLRMW